MSRVNNLIANLNTFLSTNNRNAVKNTIGDSTNNHRTLTVNQVIRYLRQTKRYKFASQIEAVYNRMKDDVQYYRMLTDSSRSDAIDINEFINVVDYYLENDNSMSRKLGNVISKVG